MLYSAVLQIIGGIAALWLATTFIPGVSFTGPLQAFLITGATLGGFNAVLKPVLNLITLPLRLLTLGLFALVIQAGLVFLLDALFPELVISGLIPLLQTTVVVWIVTSFLSIVKK
ncbi:MAG: phage holin family protein [bacterium]|nr:phage holin family protein [bacterium]